MVEMIACSSSSVRRAISDRTEPLLCQRVSVRLGSASRSATLRPTLCQYTARQAMVVDFPAPPLAVAATRTLALGFAILHRPTLHLGQPAALPRRGKFFSVILQSS